MTATISIDFLNFYAIAFFCLFALMWLGVTYILDKKSGWFDLVQEFPDHEDEIWKSCRFQTGSLGRVRMNGVLHLSVCASGLRLSQMWVFAPFSKSIFIPWDAIKLERRNGFLWNSAELRFGRNACLKIEQHLANKLALAARGKWPEVGVSFIENRQTLAGTLLRRWLLGTAFASTCFILVPWLDSPDSARPPVVVAILFPALVLGASSLITYFVRRHRGN